MTRKSLQHRRAKINLAATLRRAPGNRGEIAAHTKCSAARQHARKFALCRVAASQWLTLVMSTRAFEAAAHAGGRGEGDSLIIGKRAINETCREIKAIKRQMGQVPRARNVVKTKSVINGKGARLLLPEAACSCSGRRIVKITACRISSCR